MLEKIIKIACMRKGITNISQIKMPLIIPSIDLYTGAVYIFTSVKNRNNYSDEYLYVNDAPIEKVVRASCSYPGVFSPCKYKNTELIDGGIRENVPWKITKQMGAGKVISITFGDYIRKKNCPNIIDVVSNSIGIICHELSNYELCGADYIMKINTPEVSLLDVTEMETLYQCGYNSAKNKIKDIKQKILEIN